MLYQHMPWKDLSNAKIVFFFFFNLTMTSSSNPNEGESSCLTVQILICSNVSMPHDTINHKNFL